MNTYNKRTQDDENVLEIVSDSRICCGTLVATTWPTRGSIPEPFRIIWDTFQ